MKEYYEKHHAIGGNIVIATNTKVLESYSYGVKDIEENIPSTDKTIYRIASISKTVGAIGLMQLVEKGLIDLDEDISKYLGYKVCNPNFPDDIITVKMLTEQTSSIQDGYDDENPQYDDIIKGYNGLNGTYIDCDLEELLTKKESEYYTEKTFGNYRPGTRFCYSNFGCGIMACIIEKVSQELYVDYMENHIFKPLNLNASFKSSHLSNQDEIASMYAYSSKGLHKFGRERFLNSKLPVFSLGNNYRGPAGGLFITMNDLSKIMQVFLNYGTLNGVKILRRESVEYMYETHWVGMPYDGYTAKGIQMKVLSTFPGLPLRGHTGGAYGVRSYMFFSLKYKIGACFITNGLNSENEDKDCQELFNETIDYWQKKYITRREELVLIKKDEILLEERTIKHKDLFINSHKFIMALAISDALNTVGNFDIDNLTFKMTVNNITYTFSNIIYYHKHIYINLDEVINVFNIKTLDIKDKNTLYKIII